MTFVPYTRIDNQYYQPYNVGDIVWDIAAGRVQKARIIEVDNEFNKRNRRNAIKLYWIGPANMSHLDYKKPMHRIRGFANPHAPFFWPGHGQSADELYRTKEQAIKALMREYRY